MRKGEKKRIEEAMSVFGQRRGWVPVLIRVPTYQGSVPEGVCSPRFPVHSPCRFVVHVTALGTWYISKPRGGECLHNVSGSSWHAIFGTQCMLITERTKVGPSR